VAGSLRRWAHPPQIPRTQSPDELRAMLLPLLPRASPDMGENGSTTGLAPLTYCRQLTSCVRLLRVAQGFTAMPGY